jgi:hypothetical protein
MKRTAFWLFSILIVAGLQLAGRMAPAAKQAQKTAPASVSKIDGTDLKRVSLLPEAAARLDIKTAAVREESIEPKQQVAGEVAKISADGSSAIVRVDLTESELKKVLRAEPAFVLPLARNSKESRIKAVPLSGVIANTLSLDTKRRRLRAIPLDKAIDSGLPGVIHYEISSTNHGLVSRQLVMVELPLSGAGEKRKIIPYAAVLYDAKGKTWVYTNPEPLVFVRRAIEIDTIVGDEIFLVDGPAVGTAVVTVGGAELLGTEFGVGK